MRKRTRSIVQKLQPDERSEWTECTVAYPSGRSCGRDVPDGAPVSICAKHMAKVYLWCEDQVSTHINNNETMPKTLAVLRTLADEHRLQQAAAKAVVYYVRIGSYIKIGTTYRMSERMYRLGKPTILATERGHYMLEASRHSQFAHCRAPYGKEYFYPMPDLLAHIEKVKAGAAT